MNKHQLYDPEDLESLLEHKNFNELYPEERQFVLRHIDSESEYDSLRQTLLSLRGLLKNDVDITPDQSIRRNVLDVFEARHKRPGFSLNAWFMLFTERFNGYRPVLAFGALLGIVGVSLYMYFTISSGAEMLADNQHAPRVNRSVNTDGGEALEFEERFEPSTTQELVIPAIAEVEIEEVSTVGVDSDFENVSMAKEGVAEEFTPRSLTKEAKKDEMSADDQAFVEKEAKAKRIDVAEAEESIVFQDNITENLSSAPSFDSAPSSVATYSVESVQISSGSRFNTVAVAAPAVEKVYFNWVKTAY